jgi:hypothetical protein
MREAPGGRAMKTFWRHLSSGSRWTSWVVLCCMPPLVHVNMHCRAVDDTPIRVLDRSLCATRGLAKGSDKAGSGLMCGTSVLGLADFSQQPVEMSLTLSYFSILNYIQKGNLPASAGSRSVGHVLHLGDQGCIHSTELGTPFVETGATHPMLPTKPRDRRAAFCLLQNAPSHTCKHVLPVKGISRRSRSRGSDPHSTRHQSLCMP